MTSLRSVIQEIAGVHPYLCTLGHVHRHHPDAREYAPGGLGPSEQIPRFLCDLQEGRTNAFTPVERARYENIAVGWSVLSPCDPDHRETRISLAAEPLIPCLGKLRPEKRECSRRVGDTLEDAVSIPDENDAIVRTRLLLAVPEFSQVGIRCQQSDDGINKLGRWGRVGAAENKAMQEMCFLTVADGSRPDLLSDLGLTGGVCC